MTFIIIVAYNGMKWLKQCLESTATFPVIVVDNGSTDGTVDFIKSHYQNIVLLEQKKNLGFGKANNIGISYALKKGAEFVFLLNQDAYLAGNCIEKLIETYRANPEYGVLSPIHLDGKGELLDEKFCNYVGYKYNSNFFSDLAKQILLQNVYEVPFVNAAGWMISRECLNIVGGFDPMFFHYGEDDNFCQRVIYHKLKTGVVPTTFIRHDRQRNYGTISSQYDEKYYQQKENILKAVYGNINKGWEEEFRLSLKSLKAGYLKAAFKLRFMRAKALYRERKIQYNIKAEIHRSRNLNKKKGPKYLDI